MPALGAQSPKSPLLPVVKLFQKLRLGGAAVDEK